MKINFKSTLILSVVAFVTVSLVVSNYIGHKNLLKVSTNGIKESVSGTLEKEAAEISGFLTSKVKSVARVADYYKEEPVSDEFSEITRLDLAARAMDIDLIKVGYNDGRAYAAGPDSLWKEGAAPYDYISTEMPWFNETKKHSSVYFSDVHKKPIEDGYYIGVGKNFGDGVVFTNIGLDILDKSTSHLAGDTGVSVIFTKDGTVLSSTSDLVSVGDNIGNVPALMKLYKEAISNKSTSVEYTQNGVETIAFTNEVELLGSTKWYFVTELAKQDLFSQIDEMTEASVVFTFFMILVSAILMILVLRVVYKPIIVLRDTLLELAQGEADLTQRLDILNENDDLGKITGYINKWIAENQKTMLKIKSVSDELGNVVNNIRDSSENNLSILSEHVFQTEQVVTAIAEMNLTAKNVAEHAGMAAEITQSANLAGEKSKTIVAEAQETVIALVDKVENAVNGVKAMSSKTENISSITGVIGGIAEQTNLLALNAAIEAARAGEQGRGFAVVADEVRTLASRTQYSTAEIDSAVGSLVQSSSGIVGVMDETKQSCEKTSVQTSVVSSSLSMLSNSIADINAITEQIATVAEEQTNVSSEISMSITEISEMANAVDRNIQDNAASVEAMTAMYQQLNGIVGNSKI